MKLFFFLSALLAFQLVSAQSSFEPLEYDPFRVNKQTLVNGREEATVSLDFTDALSLPFFDDFSSIGPSIETITTTEGVPVIIKTFQPHGFLTATEIVIAEMKGQDTADYINGRWYAKSVDKYQFELYSDAATLNPLKGRGRPVQDDKIGHYSIVGLNFGPNPDPFKWVNSDNIYINNRFAIAPPSVYTATFDGLNSRGERYAVTKSLGWRDTLTSRKIDLSTVKANEENAHLSFWWQAGGRLDGPTFRNFLKLEFKNTSGTWDPIDTITGGQLGQLTNVFYYQAIKIDPKYFHNNFQFRFESYGRRDGAIEVWHLDYILLDKNRDTSRWATNEGAVVSLQKSALKEYTAMPINQFGVSDLANEVEVSIRNISNSPRTFNLPFRSMLNDNILSEGDLRSNAQPALNAKELRQIKSNINLANVTISDTLKQAFIKYSVAADFTDPTSQRLNRLRNNNDSTFTHLSDYFAYDDGTFESLFRHEGNSPLNQAVVVSKFNLKLPDRLVAVDINFPKVGDNIAPRNQKLRVKVYAEQDGLPGAALDNGKDTIRIIPESDGTKLEKFQRYYLQFPLDLPAGPFYVGFQHEGTTVITFVGVDLNSAATGRQFYKYSNAARWADLEKDFGPGALMIRPVFQARNVTSITESQKGTLTCEVFPNPSSGIISIEGDVQVANLYDASGKLVQTSVFNGSESKTMGNSSLLPGFYFLHLENETLKAVKKVVIIK